MRAFRLDAKASLPIICVATRREAAGVCGRVGACVVREGRVQKEQGAGGMTRVDVLRLVEDALFVSLGTIDESTELGSVQWDSVACISVSAAFEEKLDLVLSPEKLIACKTAGDLLALVADRLD